MGKYKKGQKITDLAGSIYTLDQEIGKGGQGVVWRLQEGAFAVKFLKTTKRNQDEVRRRIQRVNRLGLDDLPISVPWVTLKAPSVGYIMKLVRGLQPLNDLLQPPQESITEWYLNSGGLRFRLRVLSAMAEVLSKLHSKGLAFADPSPNNFMVPPEPSENPNVYLIDADNVESAARSSSTFLYTPGYGAPEVVNGKSGVSTLSDAHAFAVLAFELLTLSHPLIGNDIADGEPEEEENALAGNVPWVCHSSNDSNWSERGIYPRDMVLSPKLKNLFEQTFEEGLNNPQKRPGIGKWADVLLQAADMTVSCDQCKGSYYFKKSGCPWCESPTVNARVTRFFIWDPESDDHIKFLKDTRGLNKMVHALVIQKDHPQKIYRRHFLSDPLSDADSALAEISLVGKEAAVRNLGEAPLYALCFSENELVNEREIKIGETISIPADGKDPRWYLHAGSLDTFHRVLAF